MDDEVFSADVASSEHEDIFKGGFRESGVERDESLNYAIQSALVLDR